MENAIRFQIISLIKPVNLIKKEKQHLKSTNTVIYKPAASKPLRLQQQCLKLN